MGVKQGKIKSINSGGRSRIDVLFPYLGMSVRHITRVVAARRPTIQVVLVDKYDILLDIEEHVELQDSGAQSSGSSITIVILTAFNHLDFSFCTSSGTN
jgi:hypothetical protein